MPLGLEIGLDDIMMMMMIKMMMVSPMMMMTPMMMVMILIKITRALHASGYI